MLVIDGSEAIANLLAEIFGNRGWKVDTCADRDRAIEQLAGNEPYNVIVLSYCVSGANGVQLVGLIRALEHRRMTAVVMVTGSSEAIEEALAAGADEVLLKPINLNDLICVVDKHVS